MKILVLAPHPFFQNRGTPIALRMLLETLSREGHHLTVLVYHEGEEVSIPNCTVIRIKKPLFTKNIKPGFSVKKLLCNAVMYQTAKKMIKYEDFDLIHAGEEAVFMARRLGAKYKISYVYDMDSSLPQQLCEKMSFLRSFLPFFQIFEEKAVADSIGILAVCKYLEGLAASYSNIPIIQRLEDITLLDKELDKEKDKETDLKLEPGTITFMYVGNLEKYQGIDLLLESFSLSCLENERVRLIVIGGHPDDIKRYERKTEKLGIKKGKVRFAGQKPVENLASYLAQADVLVSPRSKGYNTPMKIYSYLDSGKPLLATRMLTHTQVLDDFIAYLVEPEDSAMSLAIDKLSEDKDLREYLAANAVRRVEEEYTREAFDSKLCDFYRKITCKIENSNTINR